MGYCDSLNLPAGWQCDHVQIGEDGPLIVIVDEHHDSTAAIDENITLARGLVQTLKVTIIGVEGFACRRDPYVGELCHPGHYSTAMIPGAARLSNNTRFVDGVTGCGAIVVGVDSEGYCCELEQCEGAVADLPQNLARSEWFISSLFAERAAQRLDGALLLNCGSNHGTHIMEFSRRIRPQPADWPNGSYVRLRAPSHP